jgi:multiple sugar transport system permease protein
MSQVVEPLDTARSPIDVAAASRSGGRLRALAYTALIGYALLMFVPFLWTVVTSFKTQPEAVRLTVIPETPTLEGYRLAFTALNPPIQVLFLNSLIIATGVTITNLILGSMGGYAFARLRFPGREVLFLIVLGTLMIPDQLRLVPVYQILINLGLITASPANYLGVILVLAISAQSLFFMRQYFLTIPREYEEAAKLDGAGFYRTFWRVILPLAGPALATVAILQFQGTWNGFFWPLIILQTPDHFTLPLGLAAFRGFYQTNWPALMAVVAIATIPILVLYLRFQRYFVGGLTTAEVKG